MLKLNLGCGSHTPTGWVNVDYALGAWIAKLPIVSNLNKKFNFFKMDWGQDIHLHDLRKPLPWEDDVVDVVYSSHTLEHLSKRDGLAFLKECRRVLKPDGILRIVVPDLKAIVDAYLEGTIPADSVLEELHVSYESAKDGPLKKKLAPFIRFPHRCMYDTPALVRILTELGFVVTSQSATVSAIEDLATIELANRTEDAVIVEARKATPNSPVDIAIASKQPLEYQVSNV